MAHFQEDIHHRTSIRFSDIVPEFIQSQYPQFYAFVKAYFEFLEQTDDNPIASTYVPQDGVITVLSGNSIIVGSGTTFQNIDRGNDTTAPASLIPYDRIQVGGDTFIVRTVTNNTSLVLFDLPERSYYGNTYSVETEKSVRQAAGALRQILTFHQIDETIPDFISYFQDTFLRDFPQTGSNPASLIPKILDFYRARGSENAYRFLFRALFNKEITIQYPRDFVFTTSDAVYQRPVILKIDSTPPLQTYRIQTQSSSNTFLVGEVIDTSAGDFATVYNVINSTALDVYSVYGTFSASEVITGNNSNVSRTITVGPTATGNYTEGLLYGTSRTGNAYSLETREIVGLSSNVRARVSQVREEFEGKNRLLSLNLEDVITNDIPFNILLNSNNATDDGDKLIFTTFGLPPKQSEIKIYESNFIQEQKPGVTFQSGERISTLPLEDPLRIQGTIVGAVTGFLVESGGLDFQVGDLIFVPNNPPSINGYGAVGRVSALSQTQISSVNIDNPGEGYYVGLPLIVDNTGTGGSGLEGYVASVSAGQILTEDGEILLFSVQNPVNATDPLYFASAREAINYYELGVVLDEILTWPIVVEEDGLSGDTLVAEGLLVVYTGSSSNNFTEGETITAGSGGTATFVSTINSTAIILQGLTGTFTLGTTLTGGSSGLIRHYSDVTSSVTLSMEPPFIDDADWSMQNVNSPLYLVNLSSQIEPILLRTTILPIYINGVRTAIGEIARLEITGIGQGYAFGSPIVTLPEPQQPQLANGMSLSRNAFPFVEAELSTIASNGVIGAVDVVTGGSGYSAASTFTVTPNITSSKTGTGASLQLILGSIVEGTPRFQSTRSLASSDQYMQDESTYQPFAYVLSVEENYSGYKDVVKRFVHPMGGKLIPDRTVTVEVNAGIDTVSVERNADIVIILDSTPIIEIESPTQLQAYQQIIVPSIIVGTAPTIEQAYQQQLNNIILVSSNTIRQAYQQQLAAITQFEAPTVGLNLVIPAGPNGVAQATNERIVVPTQYQAYRQQVANVIRLTQFSPKVHLVIPAGPNSVAQTALEEIIAPTVTISTRVSCSSGTLLITIQNNTILAHLFLGVNNIDTINVSGNEVINQSGSSVIATVDDIKPRIITISVPDVTGWRTIPPPGGDGVTRFQFHP